MDAPAFDEKKEKQRVHLLIGALITVVLIIAITLTGFFTGHGWFFENVPAEMRVSKFLNTVEAGDFQKAYGIWMHDDAWQQHPQQYDYSLQRFTEDWSTKSDYGIIHSHSVKMSHRDGDSIIVGVMINGNPDLFFLLYERKNGTLSFSPVKLGY